MFAVSSEPVYIETMQTKCLQITKLLCFLLKPEDTSTSEPTYDVNPGIQVPMSLDPPTFGRLKAVVWIGLSVVLSLGISRLN